MKRLVLILVAVCLIALPIGLWTSVGCDGEFLVTITEPQDGAVITEKEVEVRGMAPDRKCIVMVNGEKATVFTKGKGEWVAYITFFYQGENIIKVVATRGNKEATDSITIYYNPE